MPSQMPFMTLCCTALDQTSSQMQTYQEQCMRFLHTETVCYWADPTEDRVLYGRQQNAWRDLHDWIEADFAPDRPSVAVGHMEGMMLAKGQRGLGHPPQVTKFCEEWVQSLDAWHLTAMHSICSDAKSFWIAAAVLMNNYPTKSANSTTTSNNGRIQDIFTMDINRALAAARVEEEFNIESWGLVEGGHDYDRLNASIQVTSASLLTDYLALAIYSP
jgi:ATP synthase F1 complex assembly factor 2